MKKLWSLLMALLICASAVALTACTVSKKYQQKVLDYLEKNYGSKKFELVSYSTDKGTSSRYEIKARCVDDGTDFDIYVYSASVITDGYSVTRANNRMESLLHPVVSGTDAFEFIDSIRWLRLYNEETTDYTFRTVKNPEAVTLGDIESIDGVIFTDKVDTSDKAANGIIAFIAALDKANIKLDSATFEFSVNNVLCRFKTDSASVRDSSAEELVAFINLQLGQSVSVNSIWQPNQTVNMTYVKPSQQ